MNYSGWVTIGYSSEIKQNHHFIQIFNWFLVINEENDSTQHRTSMMYEDEYNQNSKITKKSKKKTELNEENDYKWSRTTKMLYILIISVGIL